MLLNREPAVLLMGLLAPVVAVFAAFVLKADPGAQTVVNAAAAAVAGAVVAFLVRSDRLLPAITGAVEAVVLAAVGLGLPLDSGQQATILTALAAIAAYVVRDRVTAPVTVTGEVLHNRPA